MTARRFAYFILAFSLVAVVSASAGDLTKIPADPAAIHSVLEANGGLSDAMKTAAKAGNGHVMSAQLDFEAQLVVCEVARADSKFAIVVVSLSTGAVVSNDERSRFPGENVSGDWIETASGLKYFDMVVGTGEAPAGPTSEVEVHYTGYLTDGTKFDSSVDRGETITFALNRVIAGWTEGVGSMNVGGKRKLIIPASLGYGAQGAGGVIPPNATLVFDVELVGLP